MTYDLSLESHPFLRDHSLAGRAFLPLASGLDMFVSSLQLESPFTFLDVAVERGLLVNRPAVVRVDRQDDLVRLLDVRPGGREVVVFRARLASLGQDPADFPPGEAMEPRLTLEDFYRMHTFHGPQLQAITSLPRLTSTSVSGTVVGCRPRDWIPGDLREVWNLDPKVIDGAFQLAIFWAQCREGRGLLPRSVDEVTLLEALPPSAQVDVRIDLNGVDEEGVTGTIHLFNQGRRVGWLKAVRARWADPRTFRADREVLAS